MIEVTRSWTRPNTSVEWGQTPAEIVQYIQQNYDQTGKRLSHSRTPSADNLTLFFTETWNTIEDYNYYQVDPTMRQFWEDRHVIYHAAGIEYGPVTITPID